MLSNSHFRVQLASILEVLANAAVAEICELVDNGYADLHFEISRSNSENENLRRKLQIMEQKLPHESERFRARDREVEPDPNVVCNDLRGSENRLPQESVSDWHFTQWRGSTLDEEPKTAPFTTGDQCVELQECVLGFAVVKEELTEESASKREVEDLQEGITGSGTAVADSHLHMDQLTPQLGPELISLNPNPKPDPNCDLKTEPENCGIDPSLQSLGTGHSGHSSMDYEPETEQQLSRECVTVKDHTRVRRGEEEQQVNTHLSHSTCSLRPSQSHPRSSRHCQSPRTTESLRRSQLRYSAQSSRLSHSESPSDFSGFFYPNKHLTTPTEITSFEKGAKKPKRNIFICSLCGKGFVSQYKLDSHVRSHTGERPFTCTLCEKSFLRSAHLKIHQNIHTGARPYACSLCSKTFADPSSLSRHQRVHTGEKPHCCSHCGIRFSRAERLQRHLKSSHLVNNS